MIMAMLRTSFRLDLQVPEDMALVTSLQRTVRTLQLVLAAKVFQYRVEVC